MRSDVIIACTLATDISRGLSWSTLTRMPPSTSSLMRLATCAIFCAARCGSPAFSIARATATRIAVLAINSDWALPSVSRETVPLKIATIFRNSFFIVLARFSSGFFTGGVVCVALFFQVFDLQFPHDQRAHHDVCVAGTHRDRKSVG